MKLQKDLGTSDMQAIWLKASSTQYFKNQIFWGLQNYPWGLFSRPHFNLERSLKTTYQRLTPSGPLLQSGSEAQPRALLRQRLCLVLWTP